MNKQLFRTVLLWALFALHILCSAPVVGQTTTSVTPVVTFPSELPIGTNYLEKLMVLRTNAKVSVYGYMVVQNSGIEEYVALASPRGQGGIPIASQASATDEELLLEAAPVANEFLASGLAIMNSNYCDMEGTVAFARVEMSIGDVSSDTKLFTAVWWRYILRDEDGVFKSQELLADEIQIVPAFQNDNSGYFRYSMPNGASLDFSVRNILLDAIGPEGPDTSSSLTGGLPQTGIGNFSLPSKYIDGSYSGKLYIQLSYNPENGVPREQVLAVDLQSGKIDRPQIRVIGVRLAGPYTFNGKPIWQLRPNCLAPRGTSFGTYFSQKPDGPWTFFKTVTVGAGGDVPLIEFETGLNFDGSAGFVKVIVDDNTYPDLIIKALPKP